MKNDINLQISSLKFKLSWHLGSVYTRFFGVEEKKKRKEKNTKPNKTEGSTVPNHVDLKALSVVLTMTTTMNS